MGSQHKIIKDKFAMVDASFVGIGIDPGSKTSPTGVSCVYRKCDQWHIYATGSVVGYTKKMELQGFRWDPSLTFSIREICNYIQEFAKMVYGAMSLCRLTNKTLNIFCEEPRLMGKANKNILKLLGAIELLFSTSYDFVMHYVDPSTSKKVVGGHGFADKDQILNSLKVLIPDCNDTFYKVDDKICYDISDAVAAVLAGYAKINDN